MRYCCAKMVLPSPLVRGEEDLQHCEGVHHLPPYVLEGQASAVLPPGVSVDEEDLQEGVLAVQAGAVLPHVVGDEKELHHCEGVQHLPLPVREGQVGAVLLPPGVGCDEVLQEGIKEPETAVELLPISPSGSRRLSENREPEYKSGTAAAYGRSCSCAVCSYTCFDFGNSFPHLAHPMPLPTCSPLPCSYRQHPIAKYFPHRAHP